MRTFADLINKYIVEIALRQSGDLKRLGRMMCTEAVAKDDVSRIDFRRGIVSLLQKAGRPLYADEIRRGLMALCGVSKSFRFATVDPVLRVGVGLWRLTIEKFRSNLQINPIFSMGLLRS